MPQQIEPVTPQSVARNLMDCEMGRCRPDEVEAAYADGAAQIQVLIDLRLSKIQEIVDRWKVMGGTRAPEAMGEIRRYLEASHA